LKIKFKQFAVLLLNIHNLCGFCILIIVALFYKSNMSVNRVGIIPITTQNISLLIFYLIIEYGIFMIFIYKKIKNDCLFWVLMITMIICSFVTMGIGSDFAWRTCIPATFYLMLLIMREVSVAFDIKRLKYILLTAVFLIGSITPNLEIFRTIKKTSVITLKHQNETFRSDGLQSVFIDNICYTNFVGKEDAFFNKYLRK